MKTITVCTDKNDGEEAVYMDGRCVMNDSTIHSSDIAEFAGDDPIIFRHLLCRLPDGWGWPANLQNVPVAEDD